MVSDVNKGITFIGYNHLNLPKHIVLQDGTIINYVYDAAGKKLQKEVQTAMTITTDYVSGKHYVNGTLSFMQHAEGRTLYNAGLFDYEYNLAGPG